MAIPGNLSLSVKVFLLPLDSQRSFFYSEDRAEAGGPSHQARHGGLRGLLERTYRRVLWVFRHPQGRLTRWMKRTWDWLERRMHPDEPLLAALRTAPTIEVHHGAALASTEARALWCRYLRGRMRRHLLWLAFDGVLTPLTGIFLAPLPGPNFIGYWFTYRAVLQLLMLLGIRRASSGRVETTFHPDEDLDAPDGPGDPQWLDRTATQYALNGLHDFVARISPPAATTTATTTATAKAQDESGGAERPCDS